MNKSELNKNIQQVRYAWEDLTTRNQDLDDERLNSVTGVLSKLIKFYYSDTTNELASEWLDLDSSDFEYDSSYSKSSLVRLRVPQVIRKSIRIFLDDPYPVQECKWKRKG